MAKKPLSNIEKDIMKKVNKAMAATAKEIGLEIEKSYESAIDAFYADKVFYMNYPTRTNMPMYDRTYSLYKASSGYKRLKNTYRKRGNDWLVGIIVDTSLIGEPYKESANYVFGRAYERGIHGFTRNEVIERNRNYDRWHQWQPLIPYVSNIKPKQMFEIEFNKVTSDKNLAKVSKQIKQKYGFR